MQIDFNVSSVPFVPWLPVHGQVYFGPFAFDSETTLIDRERPWLTPAYVLGAVCDGSRGYFITRERVESFFAVHQNVPVVMHNATFDLRVVAAVANQFDVYSLVDLDLVWDTQLLHRLFTLATTGHASSGKGQSTLEHCVTTYLCTELPKDLFDDEGDSIRLSYGKWLGKPPNKILPMYLDYLAKDAMATYAIFRELDQRIRHLLSRSAQVWGYVSEEWMNLQVDQWGPLTHHIQLRGAIVLDQVTSNGIGIDTERCAELQQYLTEQAGMLRDKLRDKGYLPGQPGSSKALQQIMQRLERTHPRKTFPRTPSGKYATGRDDLQELSLNDDFIDDYLQFQAVEKLRGTFLDKMLRKRIHPSFDVLLRSGRTSSFGQINAQNLPRDDRVRSCFVPSPGHVFIAADYSTVELATLAQSVLSQLQIPSQMAEAINQRVDLHRLVAARVTGKPIVDVTSDDRQKAKPINFGKPGGMGANRLRSTAKKSYDVELSDDEVGSLTDAWFDLFPEMRDFLAREDDLGLNVARLFDIAAETRGKQIGRSHYSQCDSGDRDCREAASIQGWMLLKVLRDLDPRTNNGKPYDEDDIEFFWERVSQKSYLFPEKLAADIASRRPSNELRKAAINLADLAPCFTHTGRLRAAASFCARHNTLFQGLAADGAKLALWKLWRAQYPIVNFIHDEVLIEVPMESDLLLHAEAIRKLMIDGMKSVVPDVKIDVEYSAAKRWCKNAEKVVIDGRLVPWDRLISEADLVPS